MNPDAVQLDHDEYEAVLRVRMVKWLGVTFNEWDAMSYKDQCFAMEIRRADNEIQAYEAAKRKRK